MYVKLLVYSLLFELSTPPVLTPPSTQEIMETEENDPDESLLTEFQPMAPETLDQSDNEISELPAADSIVSCESNSDSVSDSESDTDSIELYVLNLHLRGGYTILPETLLPGCKRMEHPYLPLYCLQFNTVAFAGKSNIPSTILAQTVMTPFGELILMPVVVKFCIFSVNG